MTEDAFDVLGLDPRLDLESSTIEREYLARAAAVHPDLSPDDPEGLERLAVLNEARQALLEPERRANILLMRLGGPSAEDDRTLPDGFLMDMMDVREQAERALSGGDEQERQALLEWARGEREASLAKLSPLLREGSAPSDLRDARVLLNAWRYIERMIEQIGEKRSI